MGARNEWDADYHDPCWDPILVDDELWIYYRSVNRQPDEGTPLVGHAIGLATLRRDGFVSLNAGDTPGIIVTRPLTLPGHALFVNAEVGDGGYVKAEVMKPDETPLDGFTLADSRPLTENTTKGRLTWQTTDEVHIAPGQHLRLRFQLQNAKLYSLWLE